MNTKLTLLHYFADERPALGIKAVCGQVMTTPAPGETQVAVGLCPVCASVLERTN